MFADPSGTDDLVMWPTAEPTDVELAAEMSIQSEHEPLYENSWGSFYGRGDDDGGFVDPTDLRSYAQFAAPSADEEDIYALLEVDSILNAPPSPVEQVPLIEKTLVNAPVTLVMQPAVMFWAMSSPDSPTVAEYNQQIRPFPYEEHESVAGEVGEFALHALMTMGVGALADAAASAPARAVGVASRDLPGSLTTRGTGLRGGTDFPKFDVDKLRKIQASLKKQGVDFSTEYPELLAEANAEALYIPRLDPKTGAGMPGIIIHHPNPTRRAIIEELTHLGQHRSSGWAAPKQFLGPVLEFSPALEYEAHSKMLQLRSISWTEAEAADLTRMWQHWFNEVRTTQ